MVYILIGYIDGYIYIYGARHARPTDRSIDRSTRPTDRSIEARSGRAVVRSGPPDES
jgi:hypothetical protein